MTRDKATRLVPNAVHVWMARVSAHAPRLATFAALLDAEEREKARRFYFDEDRTQYVIAHGIARSLLGTYMEVDPAALHFETGPYGKPVMQETFHDVGPLEFNMSHSGDLVAVAVSRNCAVGIDVERWVPLEYDEMCESFFSSYEQRTLRALPPDEKGAAFFACWTRKEAYIKATGLGVSQGLDYFDVTLTPDTPARLLADRRSEAPASAWTMRALEVPHGYAGAVVAAGADVTIEQYEWLAGDEPESPG